MTSTEQRVATRGGLIRAIGRWSLVALTINVILGSGIFGLPSQVANLLGRWSVWSVVLAGAATAVIVACYAEVSSQFTETGGTYIYCREAFGRLTGLEVGWMMMLSRLTACAANANLLVIYAGTFWPEAARPANRIEIITVLLGILLLVNYRGVRDGSLVSNVFTIAKLIPLAVVMLGGTYFLTRHSAIQQITPHTSLAAWRTAMLLLFFAYGGYEAAMNPMGEARDPKRDAPFALFTALAVVTLIYTVIQWVVVGVLPGSLQMDRPLAEVARITMGSAGVAAVGVGTLVSGYGYLSANFLAGPRMTFAFAEQGDFPKVLAAVHPRFRTPHVSIVLFAGLCWGLALLGSFSWNVTLSAVARLLYYGAVCAAVPVLRRKRPTAGWVRLPGGSYIAVIGVLICVVLLTGVDFSKSLILLATISVAFLNWLAVRKQKIEQA